MYSAAFRVSALRRGRFSSGHWSSWPRDVLTHQGEQYFSGPEVLRHPVHHGPGPGQLPRQQEMTDDNSLLQDTVPIQLDRPHLADHLPEGGGGRLGVVWRGGNTGRQQHRPDTSGSGR